MFSQALLGALLSPGHMAGFAWLDAYVKAPNAETGDSFGRSVALSGDVLAVGAGGEDSCTTGVNTTAATDNGCSAAGAAYVYTRSGGEWRFDAYVKAPNAEANDRFGGSVALSGDVLAVGAGGENSCTTGVSTTAATDNGCDNAGAVYVYTRSGGEWRFEAYVKAPNAEARDSFGWSVALSGDVLAVGAGSEDSCTTGVSTTAATDNGCDDAGAVYVYTRSGGEWRFEAYVKAPNAGAEDRFGLSVALSGDVLAVGAGGEESCTTGVSTTAATDNGCDGAGAVYGYIRSGGEWRFEAYVKAPNAEAHDSFGDSVALSGDVLAVGAYGEDSCTTGVSTTAATDNGCGSAGAVYVYTRSGGEWRFEAYVKAPNAETGDYFGWSVALSGDVLAVGAVMENSCTTGVSTTAATDNGCYWSGAAYVYTRSGGEWRFEAYVKAPNAGANDYFGESVALSGDVLAVGTYHEDSCTTGVSTTAATDNGCYDAGAVYVYSSPPPPAWPPLLPPSPSPPPPIPHPPPSPPPPSPPPSPPPPSRPPSPPPPSPPPPSPPPAWPPPPSTPPPPSPPPPSPPPLPPVAELHASVNDASSRAVESATASAFDPTRPPSRCIDGSLGEEGTCRVPASADAWLQLNLFSSASLLAFRVEASSAAAAPGLLAFDVWVSEAYAQDYSNASERCFVGVAPQTMASFYQPCVARGRFVRLRLLGEARTLTLAHFEVLSAAPFASPPVVDVSQLDALPPSAIRQAVFKSGGSGERCVDGDAATSCGYDASCAQSAAANSSTCPVWTLPLACATFPQLSDSSSCAAVQSANASCDQPAADDPYVDVELSPPRPLSYIGLQAPPSSDDLGHYLLFRGQRRDALEPCTFAEGAASDDGVRFVRQCEGAATSWVRVLLPGRDRRLQLDEITLYLGDAVAPTLPPPFAPPSPPPPTELVDVSPDGDLTQALDAAWRTAGLIVRLQIRGTHRIEPFAAVDPAASEVWLEGDGTTELLVAEPNSSLVTFRDGPAAGQRASSDAAAVVQIHLLRLTIRGQLRVNSSAVAITLTECRFLPTEENASLRALHVDDGLVELINSSFVNLPAGGLLLSRGKIVARRCVFSSNRARRGGAALVLGGELELHDCLVEKNSADEGGGLAVDGGAVLLANQTQLRDNAAAVGASAISSPAAGGIRYALPAPLGRWVLLTRTSTAEAHLAAGALDEDYPFACPAGSFGNGLGALEQSRPTCSGLCPAGFFCAAAAVQPQRCTRGTYCSRGSAQPIVCPEGTFGEREELRGESECSACAPGSWCAAGLRVQCSPGYFNPSYGQKACRACEGGSYTAESNSTACRACERGAYCKEGGSAPLPCPAGTFSNATNLTSADECTQTARGFFSPPGSVAPSPCAAGTYNDAPMQAVCAKCEAGSFQEAEGATACHACERGAYCKEGGSAPLPCPAGTFSNATNLTSADECTQTARGFFSPPGSVAPTPCAAGMFSRSAGRGKCQPCKRGQYQNDTAATSCRRCPAGFFCETGSSSPLPCPAGTFSDEEALSSAGQCRPCPPGAACAAGSLAPLRCAPGTYNALPRQHRCRPCAAGTFWSNATACAVCGAGSYSPNVLSCLPCPVNEYCHRGASIGVTCPFAHSTTEGGAQALEDCMCKSGYYLKNLSCVACSQTSPGLDCRDAGVRLEALPLLSGYWRAHELSEDVRPCFTPDACAGSASNRSNATWVCADGHTGPFCELCEPEHYRAAGGTCAQCSGSRTFTLVFLLAFGGVLLAVTARFIAFGRERDWQRFESGSDLFHRGADVCEAGAVLAAEVRRDATACGESAVKRLLFRWKSRGEGQRLRDEGASKSAVSWRENCIAVVFFLLFLVYPSTSQSVFSTFQCIRLDDGRHLLRADLSIDCDSATHHYYRLWAFLMLVVYPLGIPALYFVLLRRKQSAVLNLQRLETRLAALEADRRLLQRQRRLQQAARLWSEWEGGSGCRSPWQVLHRGVRLCVRLCRVHTLPAEEAAVPHQPPKEVLRQRAGLTEKNIARLEMQLAEWKQPAELSAADAELELKRKLQVEGELARQLAGQIERERALLPDHLQKLVGGFRFRVYMFELVECARKLLVVGGPVFFDPPGSVQQLIYGIILCFVIFGAYGYFQPYANSSDNGLATLCQMQIFFALLASVISAFDAASLRGSYNIGLLLIFLTCLPIFLAILTETSLPSLLKQTWVGSVQSCWKCVNRNSQRVSWRGSSAGSLQSKDAELQQSPKSKAAVLAVKSALTSGRIATKLRILVSFVQVLGPLGVVYDIQYPPIYDSMLRWLRIFEFNLIEVMPLTCIYDTNFHTTLWLRTVVPLVLVTFLFVLSRCGASRPRTTPLNDGLNECSTPQLKMGRSKLGQENKGYSVQI